MPAYTDAAQVEAGMAESIKESCKLGVAAYAAQAREQWVLEWPGQVVLAVSAIFWTSAVTNALKNGIPGEQLHRVTWSLSISGVGECEQTAWRAGMFSFAMILHTCVNSVTSASFCQALKLKGLRKQLCGGKQHVYSCAGGVKAVADKSTSQLNNIVGLVRGQLTKLQRSTLSALVVMDVHARDVTANLAAQGIEGDVNDFAWLSQLRMYWEVTACPP